MAEQALPTLRVLLIDDNLDFLTTYRVVFDTNQIPLEIAHDGREALTKARSFLPNVIICDIMMPDINGKDFLVTIKKDPALTNIPVIMLSALPDDMQRDEFLQLGATEYLEKMSTDPNKLLTITKAITGLSGPSVPAPAVAIA